jgi:peptide/nickel transport system permease protein
MSASDSTGTGLYDRYVRRGLGGRWRALKASARPKWKQYRLSFYLLNRNPLTRVALITILILVLVAIFAPWLVPDMGSVEGEATPEEKLEAPSMQHPFGTDELGRDLFSRVIYGTRISLTTAVLAVGISLMIGVPLGAIAGTLGRAVDDIIMRVTDIFLSFPALLLAIAIAAFLGPSLQNAILAIAVSWWPYYTRIVRGQAVSIRERQFVKAARATGTSPIGMTFRHVLPNAAAPVIIQACLDMGQVILMVASLSFLGLGAQPPAAEWGLMISTSRTYFLNAWWYIFFPGAAIVVTALAFSLLGDGLREILDPRTRKL